MSKVKRLRFPQPSHLARRLGRSAAVPSGEATSRRRGRGFGNVKSRATIASSRSSAESPRKDEEAEEWMG